MGECVCYQCSGSEDVSVGSLDVLLRVELVCMVSYGVSTMSIQRIHFIESYAVSLTSD